VLPTALALTKFRLCFFFFLSAFSCCLLACSERWYARPQPPSVCSCHLASFSPNAVFDLVDPQVLPPPPTPSQLPSPFFPLPSFLPFPTGLTQHPQGGERDFFILFEPFVSSPSQAASAPRIIFLCFFSEGVRCLKRLCKPLPARGPIFLPLPFPPCAPFFG